MPGAPVADVITDLDLSDGSQGLQVAQRVGAELLAHPGQVVGAVERWRGDGSVHLVSFW